MAKAVAKKEEAQLPAGLMADMEADAQEHGQSFDPDQLIIPRITILQDLSPQLKERKAEYVRGAKVGDLYNNVTGTLDKSITFTPSKFTVQYIAWQENRGGLIDPNLTKKEVEDNFTENGLGQWTGLIVPRGKQDAVRCDVIETATWVGIASGMGWGPMPVAIAFPSTKAKAARRMNTHIDLTKMKSETTGKMFKVPAFYFSFIISTALEEGNDNEWFGYVPQPQAGWADDEIIAEAKALKIAFDDDKATISEQGAE